jgi:hypothetical protein
MFRNGVTPALDFPAIVVRLVHNNLDGDGVKILAKCQSCFTI